MKKTLFISDLHLEEQQPVITQCFLKLLNDCDETVDALYILGDFFEVWIGDDHQTRFNQQIIDALHQATQRGLAIYFLHGNRDFLIGKRFSRNTGVQLLQEETRINLYNTPVLLMHGDTLCTRDTAYLKSRKVMRNPLFQAVFLCLPLTFRQKIANKIRANSMQHIQATPLEMMDVTQSEVQRVMQQHQVTTLIHGHTHQPAFHELAVDGTPALRIVLGAWHDRGNMLVWYENGKKEWVEFD